MSRSSDDDDVHQHSGGEEEDAGESVGDAAHASAAAAAPRACRVCRGARCLTCLQEGMGARASPRGAARTSRSGMSLASLADFLQQRERT